MWCLRACHSSTRGPVQKIDHVILTQLPYKKEVLSKLLPPSSCHLVIPNVFSGFHNKLLLIIGVEPDVCPSHRPSFHFSPPPTLKSRWDSDVQLSADFHLVTDHSEYIYLKVIVINFDPLSSWPWQHVTLISHIFPDTRSVGDRSGKLVTVTVTRWSGCYSGYGLRREREIEKLFPGIHNTIE